MNEKISQIRSYADRLFDGELDAGEVKELEALIIADQKNLQAYVEMINLHGALIFEGESQTDEQAVMSAFRNDFPTRKKMDRRTLVNSYGLLSAAVAGFMFLGWFVYSNVGHLRPLGIVMHLTSDAKSRSLSLELGRTVSQGKTIDVEQGVVSLQLGRALVDLIGPAKLRLDQVDHVRLERGALIARVLPGGEGFTVETPGTQVIDLGTEFSVEYSPVEGTLVSVQKGRTRVNALNSQGAPTQVLELTSHRSAIFQPQRAEISETKYSPGRFQQATRARGTILSTSGQLRTSPEPPSNLTSKSLQTLNHILLIPEQQNVRLAADLEIETKSGTTLLTAGTVISSYLIHYDPQNTGSLSPRAAVTFMNPILGVITATDALNKTDAIFGLPETKYDRNAFRGLESDADQINLSDDGRTVSCFFGMAPPAYLDQARVIVVADSL